MLTTQRVTTPREIDAVAVLAREVWNQRFPPIIGQEQVDYMLDKFQSVPAITRQMREGDYEYYLKQSCRGRGLGRVVLAWIEEECVARGVRDHRIGSRSLLASQQTARSNAD